MAVLRNRPLTQRGPARHRSQVPNSILPDRSEQPLVPAVLAHAAQILVAGLGGLAFQWLGVPAAWLSGAVLATVLWGVAGFGRTLPRPLVDAAMLVSGTTMGAAVTPAAVAAMARYPLSLVTLVAGVVAISAASVIWLTQVSGWRRDDAILASVPGALTTVLAVAADRKADVASITIVQCFRLFVLVALLPTAVVMIGGGSGIGLIGQGQPVAAPLGLALILGGGLLAGLVFKVAGAAAPILLGAMLASTVLHVTETAPGVVPPAVATAGLVLIGVFTGERFKGLSRASLRRTVPAAVGSFLVAMAVAAAFSALSAWFAKVSYANALVAFAPGGLEVMMVLSLLLGLDPLYVGIHHVARFVSIGVVVPFVISWTERD